jgi:hypothetical protein
MKAIDCLDAFRSMISPHQGSGHLWIFVVVVVVAPTVPTGSRRLWATALVDRT